MWRLAITGGLWMALSAPAIAQTTTPGRPGPYVLDIRGATTSLPRNIGFYPPLPSSTAVPSRGYGIDVGAHVYLVQLGSARLGIGGMYLRARGTAAPSIDAAATRPSSGPATTPETAALLTTVSPQISVNFGSRAGWSYLSAGAGRAEVRTRASAFVDKDNQDAIRPVRVIDSGARSTINFGGGARWFFKSHLAFSFDVRFHMVRAGGKTTPTPGNTLVAVAAGVSLR